MGTFINGSRLKRFHELLTKDMLERMHATKSKKLALQLMKDDAREEAPIIAKKIKARRKQVSMVNINIEEDDYTAPLLVDIRISLTKTTCTTILDSRADVNVLSAEIYNQLKDMQLLPATTTFCNFTNKESKCLGLFKTTIYIQGHQELCTFYVSANTECAHDEILGQSWMAKHRCSMNWDKMTIQLYMGGQSVIVLQKAITTTPSHTIEATASSSQIATPNVAPPQQLRYL